MRVSLAKMKQCHLAAVPRGFKIGRTATCVDCPSASVELISQTRGTPIQPENLPTGLRMKSLPEFILNIHSFVRVGSA